ncbi:MAG: glycosyltransferase [Candidatus Levybacteria bacterium]|nr:glycosyltransferase [Candidatus Levybacteria bacterium]
MKTLFFTYDFPYPTTSGGKTRAYNLLKHAGENVDITLFSFTRQDFTDTYKKGLHDINIKKMYLFPRKNVGDFQSLASIFSFRKSIFHLLYYSSEVKEKLMQVIRDEKIDIVHFESFYTAYYLSDIRNLPVKTIFGTENIEHKVYEDYVKYGSAAYLKPFYFLESRKIKRMEEEFYRLSDICLAVTEEESFYIRSHGAKKCAVIENGVDLSLFPFVERKEKKEKNILFIGNFSYFPNVSAVKFFYHKVFADLQLDNVTFTIIGKGVEKLSLRDTRIKTIPYTPSIQEAYKTADVFVSPVRIGGGTNFKVLEAMASGVPIVAFPDRVEGLGIEHEKHAFLAKNAKEYQEYLRLLLLDHTKGTDMAKHARTLVEERYSWKEIGNKMNAVWRDLV